jgi:hypothetical protein
MKYYFYCLILLLIISCKSQEDLFLEKLYGQWAIEKIEYNNVNYKEDLYVNFMVFEREKKMLIPESSLFDKDMSANWELISIKEKRILINCSDVVFNGKYNVKFIKDTNKKLLGIEMKSDSTYIKAFKFFQNFDVNGKNW